MKKRMLAYIMVSLMLLTIFSASISVNSLSIKERIKSEEEKTGFYNLLVYPLNADALGTPGTFLGGVFVTLKSDDGYINRIKNTFIFGEVYFYDIPDKYNKDNLELNAYKIGYYQHKVKWIRVTYAQIWMLPNEFFNNDHDKYQNKSNQDCGCQIVDDINLDRVEKLLNSVKINSKFISIFEKDNPEIKKELDKLSINFTKLSNINNVLKSDILHGINILICIVLFIRISMVYSIAQGLYNICQNFEDRNKPILAKIFYDLSQIVGYKTIRLEKIWNSFDCWNVFPWP